MKRIGSYSEWLARHCYACGREFSEEERELVRRVVEEDDGEAGAKLERMAQPGIDRGGCDMCGEGTPS